MTLPGRRSRLDSSSSSSPLHPSPLLAPSALLRSPCPPPPLGNETQGPPATRSTQAVVLPTGGRGGSTRPKQESSRSLDSFSPPLLPALFMGGLHLLPLPPARFPRCCRAPPGSSSFPCLLGSHREMPASSAMRWHLVLCCLQEEGKVWEAFETFWLPPSCSEGKVPLGFGGERDAGFEIAIHSSRPGGAVLEGLPPKCGPGGLGARMVLPPSSVPSLSRCCSSPSTLTGLSLGVG